MTRTANPYRKSANALQRMRRAIFSYDDTPKEEQAGRVLLYLKARKMRGQAMEPTPSAYQVGPYSGLTRQELRATGTCETDWF